MAHPVLLQVARFNPKEVRHGRDDERKGKRRHPGKGRQGERTRLIVMSLIAIMLSAGQGLAVDTTEVGLFTAVAPMP